MATKNISLNHCRYRFWWLEPRPISSTMCNELNNYHGVEILVSRFPPIACRRLTGARHNIHKIVFCFPLPAAEQCGADVICLNCYEVRNLAAGTTDAVKLSRFFDKVIERKYYPRGSDIQASDKRKYTTQYSSTSPPKYASTSAYHKHSNYPTMNGVI